MDNASIGVNTITQLVIGARSNTDTVYLEYKLKTVKRYNGSLLTYDLSATVSSNASAWNFKQIGSNNADKFYLFAQSSQILGPEPGTKTDHDV